MSQRRNVMFYFFLNVVFASVVYMFYASPLREKVEDYFYDVRVRLQPAVTTVPNITLVTIDEQTIDEVEGELADDLDAKTLVQIVKNIQKTAAKEIVILYFSNIFDYESAATQELVNMVQADSRITLGTLGLNFKNPFFLDFAKTLEPISKQVRGIETFKDRSTNIVRDLPYFGYRGIKRDPLLPLYLDQKLDSEPEPKGTHYRLNYIRPTQFTEVKAEDLNAMSALDQVLDDKIVIVGYKSYRKWPAQTLDPMLVNTPFRGTPDTFMNGEPIIYLTATAIDNLVNNRALRASPHWVSILQVAIVTLLFGFAWRLGPIVGSIISTGLFIAILLAHALVFEFYGVWIPFADTFLFSSFAIILGAVGALRNEIQKYADIRARVKSDRELDQLQSRFLDRFAQGVSRLNQSLLEDSRKLSEISGNSPTEQRLAEACVESGLEFEEFLGGIKQLASTSGDNRLTNPVQKDFLLIDLIKRILGRFEQQAMSKDIQIKTKIAPDMFIHSSYEILDTIVYNLISNAIKYSPTASTIEVSATAKQNLIRLCVKDQGPGIPPELQQRVFEKFYRVKNDNVYRIKGTGIGLYLTKFFAEKIGAGVGLISEPGKGSTFYLDIKQ